MSHKSCNLEEAWFIYSLLSIDPFGGTCGSCRPLRLDTGVLVGLVWTDPVRGFALRDRWCVSKEYKASYLKKCLSLSHKPAQDRAGCQTTAEHAGERILIKTNLLTTVILAVASFMNDTIVSENTLHLIAIKRDTYCVLLNKISQYLARFSQRLVTKLKGSKNIW